LETPVAKSCTPTGPTSLADLLQDSRALRHLKAQAGARRRLTEQVRQLLPPAEAEHLLGAHVNRSGELVLVADSPAWAARIRYAQDTLRRGLAPLAVSGIRVKARPPD
jgi:hypothetical protein